MGANQIFQNMGPHLGSRFLYGSTLGEDFQIIWLPIFLQLGWLKPPTIRNSPLPKGAEVHWMWIVVSGKLSGLAFWFSGCLWMEFSQNPMGFSWLGDGMTSFFTWGVLENHRLGWVVELWTFLGGWKSYLFLPGISKWIKWGLHFGVSWDPHRPHSSETADIATWKLMSYKFGHLNRYGNVIWPHVCTVYTTRDFAVLRLG